MVTKKKGGGAKTSRTEMVSVRLDPKTKYLADIAARVQRRTLSSYVDWAVENGFKDVWMRGAVRHPDEPPHEATPIGSVADLAEKLWDVEEADRFAILASYFPWLLDHDEQRLWKLIQEVWDITQPTKDNEGPKKGFRLDVKDLELLRTHWETFKNAAAYGGFASDLVAAIQGNKNVKAGIDVFGNVAREIKARREKSEPTSE